MGALEARLMLQIAERHRRLGQAHINRDRFVFLIVAIAMEKCRIRSESSTDDDGPAGCHFQQAAVIDAEGQLDDRAGLAEEDGGIDAGERRLSEFGDRVFLAIARLDFRAQARKLGGGLGVRRPTDEVKRLLLLSHEMVAMRLTLLTLELVPALIFKAVMNDELSTGDLARACGVSPDSIRFYERRGAISARRLASGYRRFPAETVRRVHVIRRAIAIGFSMEEIVRFFSERRAGRPPCKQVRAAAETKLADIDRRIADLIALREQIAAILEDWDIRLANRSDSEPVHLLESLERSSS